MKNEWINYQNFASIQSFLLKLSVQLEFDDVGLDGRRGGHDPLVVDKLESHVWLGGGTDLSQDHADAQLLHQLLKVLARVQFPFSLEYVTHFCFQTALVFFVLVKNLTNEFLFRI